MNRHALNSIKESILGSIPRRIYKIVYKCSHPRSHRHNRRYWPHYRVERNSRGELQRIHFKNHLVVDNTRLAQSHHRACMLVATGPSVRDLDSSHFHRSDIDYIGVNGAIALDDVRYLYYVIIDFNFTEKRFDLVRKVIGSRCTLFTIPRCLDIILNKVPPSDIRCEIKVLELVCEGEVERFFGARERVDTRRNHFYAHRSFGFSGNIFDATFDYFTVTYVALQIINFLSYRKVFVAGLDMNNFARPRFYENVENKQSTMLDHYSAVIFPAFDAAARFFRESGIQVYNLSADSAVESFEKIRPSPDALSDALAEEGAPKSGTAVADGITSGAAWPAST